MGILDRLVGRILGRGQPSRLTAIHKPDGSTVLADDATVEYMVSSKPDPSQDDLDVLLERTTRAIVRQGGVVDGTPLSDQILIEEGEPEDLAELRTALRIQDGGAGHCMCYGDPSIELLDADSERIALVGVHHGQSIRWDGWKDDAKLSDGMSLLTWLAARGVEGPLEEHREALRREQRHRQAWVTWVQAAPDCLRPILPQLGYPPLSEEQHREITTALTQDFPQPAERLRRLFEWFGSSTNTDPGTPAYEVVAEEILMRLPMSELTIGLDGEPSEGVIEGALRLFTGWHFGQERGGDIGHLSERARARLLAHAERTQTAAAFERVRSRLGGGDS